MKIIHVLEQDGRAPDSYNYFKDEFKKIVGISILDFKKINKEKESDDGMRFNWESDEFILEYSGDYPFHILYSKKGD